MLLDILFGQDSGYYNLGMIFTYVSVILMAFVICVIISHNLHIYHSRNKEQFREIFQRDNYSKQVQLDVVEEISATSENLEAQTVE